MNARLFTRRHGPILVGVISVLVLAGALALMFVARLASSQAMIIVLACILAASVALLITSHQLRTIARLNEERSGLLQLTFHQIGEPITILQWSIESLEEIKNLPEEVQRILPESLADMREGVRRLSSIIDTLQEAEKVELCVFKNNPVELPIRKVLQDALAVIVPASPGKDGRIILEAPDARCSIDPYLLTVVLRRLVENALEYSDASTSVRVRARFENGRWLCIDIEDDGCGIPAGEVSTLGQKYYRASNACSMKPDGNGLGMYIARGLVQLMGGRLDIASIQNRGTTVTIRLPHHAG